jgi:hypothetical protein
VEYDEDDDDDEDEDEDDAEWVRERWNRLMDRQRLAEADVRRTILNRDRLGPSVGLIQIGTLNIEKLSLDHAHP